MDVAGRAEQIRNLGKTGSWKDLAATIDTALAEKSPSVRLLAGVAANAILVRERGTLTDAQRAELVRRIGPLDPGVNPALLLALAPAETLALDRLGRMLRDGRTEVRTGATAVVRRMLLSRWCREPGAITARIGTWLGGRLAADATADLIRLVGEAGLAELRPMIPRLPGTGKSHHELVDECLARLNRVADPAGWDGWWIPDGRELLEEAEEKLEVAASWWIEGPHVIGRPGGAGARDGLRLVYAQRAGESERTPVILGDGQARWLHTGTAAARTAEAEIDLLPPAIAERLAAALAGQGAALRARAMCLVLAGQPHDAIPELTAATGEKRPKVEVFLWLARALAQVGDAAGAAAAATAYLERAPKKGPFRAEAEALAG